MSPYKHLRAHQSKYDETNSTSFPETNNEKEVEVVDELVGILVECLKRADIKTREALLRRFFFEIEKEESLERFLVERIKHSKLYSESCLDNNETRGINNDEMMSEKPERFKVRTVRVGEVVREEAQ
ncbi:hypothetical protein PHJA_001900900 [Phtheirospermum japonicum]|uniref:Uncharacterized protein n=1 Tax=Phtheirospermum japonicum TaxID=374723 RepID=A0A830CJW2_9LAMI|nr:hypothetical protein PHJA_001900900 [Phtheirospermum japonicum]